MPELPEVETFRRYLLQGNDGSPSILGKRIRDTELLWEGTLASPTPVEFFDRIKGQYISGIGRRGKNLLIRLSRDTLIIHLRMSGELVVEYRMAFNNIRKFGRIWLTENAQEQLAHLGPEPLSDDFTPEKLHQLLSSHSRQLKYFLLDQEMIAGMGNIYTDEALHRAKLHPVLKSDTLDYKQALKLWESIRQVLEEGIKNQGSSIDWMYRGGDYQNYLSVYNLMGEPCKTCETPIKRIKVGQRSTYFCPSCQPPPE
jgi:formamidopyrimidine-DNA glycosylase